MVPGKNYQPEDYLRILWRRKWAGLAPFLVIAIATAIVTQMLPNRYRSEAQVLIIPQQVPQNFVQPTVTTRLDQRLESISQLILSRTRLERIIQDFDLYKTERETQIMEDVVTRMRTRDISIRIDRARGRKGDPGSFTVGFQSDNPRTAMLVAERIASLFVTENLQDRTIQADQTTQFLQTQLEDARRRLIEHEEKLEQFRKLYDGQLPTQVQSNLQMIQVLQTQLQANAEAISRDRDRQLTLEKMIGDLMAISASSAGPGARGAAPAPPASAAEQLAAARLSLEQLQLSKTPTHPDVARAKRLIAELEQRADAEALNAPISTPDVLPARMAPADQKRVLELQAERDSLERRIAANQADEGRIVARIAAYRARVEAAPGREAELTELMRDYESLKLTYASLSDKSQASKLAADLERRQIGEQFRVIDTARLPERPFSPNRVRMNLMGALGGLGFGLLLIGLLEYRDTSLRTDEEVTISLALPVLAVIPMMRTDVERLQLRRRRMMAISASVVVMIAAVAVVVWKLDAVRALVR